MDIALYISELLKDHNEVSLPGIGTFYRRKISAKYSKDNGIFYPPYEEIDFQEGGHAGSELVNYISAVKRISDASARYFVNKFTDTLRQSLNTEGKADLLPVGTLVRSEKGLVLQANAPASTQFGLVPLDDPAFIPYQRMAGNIHPDTAPGEEVPAGAEEVPQNRNSKWTAVLAISILLLIAGGLAYVFYPEFFNLKTDKPLHLQKPTVPVTIVKKDTDSVRNAHDSTRTGAVKQAGQGNDTLANKAPAQLHAPDTAPAYEVIGASLALRSEAEAYLKLMQSRGIKAKIIEDTRKPKFKISLGSFTSYEEANQEKRRIQNSFNKEAWIYTLKDKK